MALFLIEVGTENTSIKADTKNGMYYLEAMDALAEGLSKIDDTDKASVIGAFVASLID